MQMRLTFPLPETMDTSEGEMAVFLASKLYESGKLSLGQAADVAGLSKRTFAELLGRYGVSLFQQTPEELQADLLHADRLQ